MKAQPDRRDVVRLAGAGLTGAVAALTLGQGEAQAEEESPQSARLFGSWHVQVAFTAGPQAGRHEQTLLTFGSGGGVVESDATGTWAHAGAWAQTGRRSYTYTLVEFVYHPDTGAIVQIVVPRIGFQLSSDANRLTSTSATTNLYIYDPDTGRQLNKITIPRVAKVTGDRIGIGYVPPTAFPL